MVFSTLIHNSFGCSKKCVKTEDKFSCFQFSSKELLYKNCLFNCFCVFENRTKLFELTGSGFVIGDFHSQFFGVV